MTRPRPIDAADDRVAAQRGRIACRVLNAVRNGDDIEDAGRVCAPRLAFGNYNLISTNIVRRRAERAVQISRLDLVGVDQRQVLHAGASESLRHDRTDATET